MAFDLRQRLVFPLLALTIGSFVALFIAELSLRLFNKGYGNAPEESHEVFHHVHPADYRFTSHVSTGEYGGHEVFYDAERLVADPDLKHLKEDSGCRVAFLGDSFTEALQVPYSKSFVGILDHGSECIVKNYGMSSYSPIFYLLQWREMVRKFNPTAVVVQLYSNDISGDETYMKIAEMDQDSEIVAIPGPEGGSTRKYLRRSFLLRFIRKIQLQLLWAYKNREENQTVVSGMVEENPDISALSTDFMKKLSNEVKDSGAQLIVTAVPSKYRLRHPLPEPQDLEFSDKWKLFAKSEKVSFLDLTDAFTRESRSGGPVFFQHDIHFNETGHTIVADQLRRTYPRLFQVPTLTSAATPQHQPHTTSNTLLD